ncbi:MAG: tRNA (N(6)-L-threonylcarbamoyladenosine(37)-C(2))-methylthiotransferase MtaB [Schwartzia sp.]|nr:tRNA (N(6)-L-threonylcarbamoyladenosine(37)-C(2))-methylthiotransferase MtaB [Schwartzia sp. (in: firmicutes)]
MNENKSVAFLTLGCKVNQIETQSMSELFRRAGYEIKEFGEDADIYVINTCSVTAVGEKKSRQQIRRAHRMNPGAVIAVTGCYAQLAPEDIAAIEGVGLVVGTKDRQNIVTMAEEAAASYSRERKATSKVGNIRETHEFEELIVNDDIKGDIAPHQRTRAFIKIQEGCENFCTYCIIPYTRGPLRSRHLDSIRSEAKRLAEEGYQEIVLTGIHLGAYGRDFKDGTTLADAVEMILQEKSFARVRLSSLESVEVDERLLTMMKNEPRFAPHLHLPLQAGSDEILRRMNRHYNTAEFIDLTERLRKEVPSLALTTDIIVGFPGETEELFAETLKNAELIGFSKIHVFPYSVRPGTPAATMPNQVPEPVKKERVHRLEAVGERTAANFRQSSVGCVKEVLIETIDAEKNTADGLTDTYIRVYCDAAAVRSGQLVSLRLVREYEDGLWGELLK